MLFTCFPKLPTELRLYIWQLALPGPRVLEVDIQSRVFSLWVLPRDIDTDCLNALYNTCKESHSIVKKQYGFYFQKHLKEAPLLISPSADVLFFPFRGDITRLFELDIHELGISQDFCLVQTLAVPIPTFEAPVHASAPCFDNIYRSTLR